MVSTPDNNSVSSYYESPVQWNNQANASPVVIHAQWPAFAPIAINWDQATSSGSDTDTLPLEDADETDWNSDWTPFDQDPTVVGGIEWIITLIEQEDGSFEEEWSI